MKLQYIANETDACKELKVILKKKLFISNVLLLKLKQTKSIYVNGITSYVSYLLKKGDKITVDFDNMNSILSKSTVKFSDKFALNFEKFDILYEDEYLLIVNKPAMIASHPSSSHYEHTLSNMVASYLETQRIYTIHIVTRLDKDTSGVCIFAKNEYIQELFVRKKEEINLKKEYIAVVNGIIEEDSGIIEKPIKRKEGSIITRTVSEDRRLCKN
ncbi:MAG: RluA family pseudouridine synthase [Clostridia bacterium]|nr:RluA family pseudouridine synthase [Clostridia bacterium]